MSGRRVRPVAAALACVALGTACASSANPFAELVAERRYEEAARTFEQDSVLQWTPDALLLAGHFYADRALPTYDVARARTALERLTRGFPETQESERARPLLFLLTEVERVEEELEARVAALEGRVAAADSLAAARAAAEQDLLTTRRRVERLEAELEEARQELERLKAVDLRPRPGAPR